MAMKSSLPSSLAIGLAFTTGAALGALLVYQRLGKRKERPKTAKEHLWAIVEHSFTGALIHAGDKLNLYEILWQTGPITPSQLAEKTGWSARWLQEFLAQAVAAGICTYDDDSNQFTLKPDYAPMLRDPDTAPDSLAGMFQFLLPLLNRADAVVEAVQTGVGVDYDWGEDVVRAMDRKNRNWFRNHLVQDIISAVTVPGGSSLIDILERGVDVADISCGCGASTIVLAKRFPRSHFYAYESSPRSLEIMDDLLRQGNITNVTICNVAERSVGDGPHPGHADDEKNMFDFVYAHDVLHDMTDPRSLIRDVRRRLSKQGCWIIVDVECHEKLADNLRAPDAELFYGYSCLLCLSCATSTTSGEGLGTFGFPASLCRQWTTQAGFTYFKQLVFPSLPQSSCFVVA